MNRDSLQQIAGEMRRRQVANSFKSHTLIRWAERIEALASEQGETEPFGYYCAGTLWDTVEDAMNCWNPAGCPVRPLYTTPPAQSEQGEAVTVICCNGQDTTCVETGCKAIKATPPAQVSDATNNNWYCRKCGVEVPPMHATYFETHDQRFGGCGGHLLSHAPQAAQATEQPETVLAPVPYDQHERRCLKIIDQRDRLHEVLDEVLDTVLGEEREEWSSMYGFRDAVEDVRNHVAEQSDVERLVRALDRLSKAAADAADVDFMGDSYHEAIEEARAALAAHKGEKP